MAPKTQIELNTAKTNAIETARVAGENKKAQELLTRKAFDDCGLAEDLYAVAKEEEERAAEIARFAEIIAEDNANLDEKVALRQEASQDDLEDDETPKPSLNELRSKQTVLAQQAQTRLESAQKSLAQAKEKTAAAEIRRNNATAELIKQQRALIDAEDDLQLALDGVVAATEAALDGVKKKSRYLVWDGTLNTAGALNQPSGPPTLAQQEAAQKRAELALRPMPVYLSTGAVLQTVATPTTVSVRITSCTPGPFAPVRELAWVQVDLKRMERMRGLLFRVEDAHGTVVYQEKLDAAGIDALTGVQPPAPDPATEQARLQAVPAQGLAAAANGPFRFSVWVSSQGDFAATLPGDVIAPIEGVLVDDRYVRAVMKPGGDVAAYNERKRKAAEDAAGKNQVAVRGSKLLNVIVFKTPIAANAARDGRSINAKVDEIFTIIDDANAQLGPVRPGELRMLVAPEWNFQAQAHPRVLSEVDRDAILNRFAVRSTEARAAQWLIAPGSILWGVLNANNGVTAVFNTLPLYYQGAQVHLYHKRQWGMDTKYKPHDGTSGVSDGAAYFQKRSKKWEGRSKTLTKGRVPASLLLEMTARWGVAKNQITGVTTDQPDTLWTITTTGGVQFKVWRPADKELCVAPAEIFATQLHQPATWTTLVDAAHAKATYELSNYFTCEGLKFAVDICADHAGGRALGEWAPGNGRGVGAAEGVDMHFVIAADVNANRWRHTARTGGFYLWVDGYQDRLFGGVVTRLRPITDAQVEITNRRAANLGEGKGATEPQPANSMASWVPRASTAVVSALPVALFSLLAVDP